MEHLGEVQSGVREVLSRADRLSRVEHAHAAESAAQNLAALRTVLQEIDVELGRGAQVHEDLCDGLHHLVAKLRKIDGVADAQEYGLLVDDTERLELRLRGRDPFEGIRDEVGAARSAGIAPFAWIAAVGGAAALAGAVAMAIGRRR